MGGSEMRSPFNCAETSSFKNGNLDLLFLALNVDVVKIGAVIKLIWR